MASNGTRSPVARPSSRAGGATPDAGYRGCGSIEFRNTTDERVGPNEKLGPVTGGMALLVHSCAGSAPPVVLAAKANTRPSVFAMNATSFAPFRPGKPV